MKTQAFSDHQCFESALHHQGRLEVSVRANGNADYSAGSDSSQGLVGSVWLTELDQLGDMVPHPALNDRTENQPGPRAFHSLVIHSLGPLGLSRPGPTSGCTITTQQLGFLCGPGAPGILDGLPHKPCAAPAWRGVLGYGDRAAGGGVSLCHRITCLIGSNTVIFFSMKNLHF